mmetsp:Transcript_58172/g.166877  ORF Transcript_58172/g.166877 Transcript_58172/m.166877 type:complete len:82 (-) Transcript_58172:1972-2217(-)
MAALVWSTDYTVAFVETIIRMRFSSNEAMCLSHGNLAARGAATSFDTTRHCKCESAADLGRQVASTSGGRSSRQLANHLPS